MLIRWHLLRLDIINVNCEFPLNSLIPNRMALLKFLLPYCTAISQKVPILYSKNPEIKTILFREIAIFDHSHVLNCSLLAKKGRKNRVKSIECVIESSVKGCIFWHGRPGKRVAFSNLTGHGNGSCFGPSGRTYFRNYVKWPPRVWGAMLTRCRYVFAKYPKIM